MGTLFSASLAKMLTEQRVKDLHRSAIRRRIRFGLWRRDESLPCRAELKNI